MSLIRSRCNALVSMLRKRLSGKPVQMAVRIRAFEIAEPLLLGQQTFGATQIVVEKHGQTQLQIADEPRLQVVQFAQPFFGKRQTVSDLLFLDVADDPLDDVARMLQVDGQRNDVGPAAAVGFVELFA